MKFLELIDTKTNKELAIIIVQDDGACVMRWLGKIQSFVFHKSLEDLKTISCASSDRTIQEQKELSDMLTKL